MEKIKQAIARCEAVMICETASHPRNQVLKYCFIHSVRTYVVPKVTDLMLIGSDEIHLFDTPLLMSRNQGLSGEQAAVKRAMDLVLGLIACVISAPFMLLIAIAVKAYDRGPVFYKQERLGLNGKKFNLIKFRTMVVDAEKNGAQWSKGDDDERIYKFGRFLRKSRLDELPQIYCCFLGSMSFIGPRPERECYYNEFEKYIHGFSERLKVKPGITGLAQVNGGYDLMPQEKVVIDVEYIKKRSLWLDIKILFKTVGVVFSHDGAK
jgi:exopolysaccharide biosynthesis polyprenyl glycosylphosphotransferase